MSRDIEKLLALLDNEAPHDIPAPPVYKANCASTLRGATVPSSPFTIRTLYVVEPTHLAACIRNRQTKRRRSPNTMVFADNTATATPLYNISTKKCSFFRSKPHISVTATATAEANGQPAPVIGTVRFHQSSQNVELKVGGNSATMRASVNPLSAHGYKSAVGKGWLLWTRRPIHKGEDMECADAEGERVAWYKSGEGKLIILIPQGSNEKELLDEVVVGAIAMLEYHRREKRWA